MTSKSVLVVCTLVALAGCHRYVNEESFGKITKYTYVTKDFMNKGGATYYEYCTPKRVKCMGSKFLAAEDFFDSPASGRLLLSLHDDYVQAIDEFPVREFHFYDTTNAQEIICKNCGTETYTSLDSAWFGNGQHLLHFPNRKELLGVTLDVLDVDGLIATRRSIPAKGATKLTGFYFPNDSKRIVWSECENPCLSQPCAGPCTLFWLNENFTAVADAQMNCQSEEMKIYWDVDSPKIGMRFGYKTRPEYPKSQCVDQNGKDLYPELQSTDPNDYPNGVVPNVIRPLPEIRK
jgi:hypothetical protein